MGTTKTVRNILFIMCDQLRRDYLGCYGHPRMRTPHIDALAKRGTRFTRCYVQAPVCGPSRMSTYTGRYVTSHGATWNFVPFGAEIPTMGDHLAKAGLRTAVVGKTHVVPNLGAMERLGIDPASALGSRLAQGGFEPYARHDGVVTNAWLKRKPNAYNSFLRANGYDAENAWAEFAASGTDEDGQVRSAWKLRNSRLQARVEERHSETAWSTDRAMDFIREQGEKAWCLHLSYIKPHWPYIAPAPYHDMYSEADVVAPVRSDAEREDEHPVYRAFRDHGESRTFSRDEVRNAVIPSYMGLVTQVDDHIGRLMQFLEREGRLDDTLIVFTSDHGDLLGDHWLGEKEMFYEPSVGVPLIVVDPATERTGVVDESIVEAIDLLPTFLDALGRAPDDQWLEGKSLLPRIRAGGEPLREAAFSELDYAFYPARSALGLGANEARAEMVCTQRWKLIRYAGFRVQLFDLQNDPQELKDLGRDPELASVRADLLELLAAWHAARRNRCHMSDHDVDAWLAHRTEPGGVEIGAW